MNRLRAILAAAVAVLAPCGLAHAQLAGSSHAPVDITADGSVWNNNQCTAVWQGAAEALQDNARLRADSISAHFKAAPGEHTGGGSANCGEIDTMNAEGQVYYVTPNQVVKGDHAVYTADSKTIVITGDVVAAQGKDVIAGTKLVINTDTGQATWASNVTGRGKPGRVRAVLYPNGAQTGGQSSDSASAPLAAPKPPPPRPGHGA